MALSSGALEGQIFRHRNGPRRQDGMGAHDHSVATGVRQGHAALYRQQRDTRKAIRLGSRSVRRKFTVAAWLKSSFLEYQTSAPSHHANLAKT